VLLGGGGCWAVQGGGLTSFSAAALRTGGRRLILPVRSEKIRELLGPHRRHRLQLLAGENFVLSAGDDRRRDCERERERRSRTRDCEREREREEKKERESRESDFLRMIDFCLLDLGF
jgi:hypothetical protein